MKEIRIGIIGAWGLRGHLASYALAQDKVKIVMAADIYRDSLDACQNYYREEHGQEIEISLDYRQVLAREDINAVFISSPDYMHYEHALAALKAGKDVYLEKPMAIELEHADEILRCAYETKSKLFLGHNMRYFPIVLKMKEMIDNGLIGEVQAIWCRHYVSYGAEAYFKDWHSQQKYSNGLLLQKGAHDIDVIHWLAGAYTQRAVGMGKLSVFNQNTRRQPAELPEEQRYKPFHKDVVFPPEKDKDFSAAIDIEDHSMLMMQLDNGVQATYMQCMYSPDSERNYMVLGSKGKLENIGDAGDCEVHVYTELRGGFRSPNIVYKVDEKSGGHGGSDPEIVKAFIDFIRDDIAPNTSPVAARMAVAAGIAATNSLRSGNIPQEISPLDAELLEYFAKGQPRA